MARKKKTEEVEPEVIVEETVATETPVEDAVAETPAEEVVVEEKPKATRKKKATKKVEEPAVVEEVKAVEEPVVEEKPKKVKTANKVETPATVEEFPYNAIVKEKVLLNVMREPNMFCTKVGTRNPGVRITILEHSGNWGKIGTGKWVNLNYIEKI